MSILEMSVLDFGDTPRGSDLLIQVQQAVERACRAKKRSLVRFTFGDIEITVADDSNIELIAKTHRNLDCRTLGGGKIGPYPAILTFNENKASRYVVTNELTSKFTIVRAYQLNEEGWVETTDIQGNRCVVTYGIAEDWYVKYESGALCHWTNEQFLRHS